MSDGLVYYMLDANRREQFVKIGFTTNLLSRVGALIQMTTSRQRPVVLALEAGGVDVERERHKQFAALCSHGEWFRYEDPLRDFIARMDHPYAFLLDRPSLWCYARNWGPVGADSAARPCVSDDDDDEADGEYESPFPPEPIDF